jgi:aromatic amino acid aminotransferase I / 2-aminoadipate transaminase
MAGMFFWIQVVGSIGGVGKEELAQRIFERCLENKVIIAPGYMFQASKSDENGEVFLRGTFACAPLEELEIGIQRLGKALLDVFT